MNKQIGYVGVVLLVGLAQMLSCQPSFSQVHSSSIQAPLQSGSGGAVPQNHFVHPMMNGHPWDIGVFLGGGLGTNENTADHFLDAGARFGKVLTDPIGPSVLQGQFEYAVELIPYWQAFTPRQTYTLTTGDPPESRQVTTGGTYSGISVTPIILRWNLVHWQRIMPWVQGAGGLIWTNHKFPPNGPDSTSVWNFEPQFGVGMHYFVKPKQSITFAANAVHISSASLGDSNPGVNATVRFQVGYTWWR